MGIGIESFGPGTFKIDSLPGFLNVSDPAQFMRKVIDDLKSAGNSTSPMRLGRGDDCQDGVPARRQGE